MIELSETKISGKGHKNHICKDCAAKPKEEIDGIDEQAGNLSLFAAVTYFGEESIEARTVSEISKSAIYK